MGQEIFSRNVMEDMVDFFLEDCIEKSGVCKCERCREDIRAFALNQLPPKYVVTTTGNAFVRLSAMSTQSQADLITAIMNGIRQVQASPRHAT